MYKFGFPIGLSRIEKNLKLNVTAVFRSESNVTTAL